jgi:hypothetical protein
MKRDDETEAERKRRIAIFLMMRERDTNPPKPPRRTTIAQEHDLWKTREARKEARNG